MTTTPIDPAPDAPADPTPDPAATPANPDDGANANLGDPGKAALAAERRRASQAEKSAKDLAARLKEYEDRDKSETDKLTERASLAEKTATEAGTKLLRLELAVAAGLRADAIEFVSGTDEESIAASIAKVQALLAASTPTGPRPDPSQGIQGTPTSIDALVKAAEAAGNTREVLRLKTQQLIQSK